MNRERNKSDNYDVEVKCDTPSITTEARKWTIFVLSPTKQNSNGKTCTNWILQWKNDNTTKLKGIGEIEQQKKNRRIAATEKQKLNERNICCSYGQLRLHIHTKSR